MNRRPVTLIDDLPDVESLDQGQQDRQDQGQQGQEYYGSSQQSGLPGEKYGKFIRTNREMYRGSGMESYGRDSAGPRENYEPPVQELQEPIVQPRYANIPHSCLDVNSHIQDCPICSRFYNNDKTIYIIIIVILSLICLLLMKKILNL